MKMFVTYGGGTDRRNNFYVVEGKDYNECRSKVEAACGPKFAFMYTEEDFAGQEEDV